MLRSHQPGRQYILKILHQTYLFTYNILISKFKNREKTCADAANNGLGMAIGVKYIEQTFDDAAKQEVKCNLWMLALAFN